MLFIFALVRSRLEASACIWHPYERTYVLLLEKVQKEFLRYMYKRAYEYYPYKYPTRFLLGCLGYSSLEGRRWRDQILMMCKVIRGIVVAPELHENLFIIFVHNNYVKIRRNRKYKSFAVPPCHTVGSRETPHSAIPHRAPDRRASL
ncbi:unnamed protein product [Euphydryas editha]|uniref:Uncharacterized protein n=1 Tax=Euphydryas editha TaxID=104508 RepID=A0AAU9TJT7_EUPED|nr:unnamed protein product [Euphydryas editha]